VAPRGRLRKILSSNDIGKTGSHQAGFHVAKQFVDFFPRLDPTKKNPRAALMVMASGLPEQWTYIHYNNKLTSGLTRNEFRVTHVRKWMERVRARPGDVVELERVGESEYRAELIRGASAQERLALDARGRWTIVPLK
jgi:hypothetical protein